MKKNLKSTLKKTLWLRKVKVPMLGFLTLLALIFSLHAFTSPVMLTEELPEESMERVIDYHYQVYTTDSVLYPPESEPLPPDKELYFHNLTEKIKFETKAMVKTDAFSLEKTDFELDLILRAPEQWEKEMEFASEIESNIINNNIIEYTSSLVLPFEDAQQLKEAIVDETDVRPRNDVSLVVQSRLGTPSLDTETDNIMQTSKEELVGEHIFAFDGSVIEPEGELFFEDNEVAMKTNTYHNRMHLLGGKLNVYSGRILFSSLLVVLLAVNVYLYVNYHKRTMLEKDETQWALQKIKKRYGGRIIQVDTLKVDTTHAIKVEVKSMKELARLADELERPILQLATTSQMQEESLYSFYVMGGEAVYYYNLNDH